MRSKKRKGDRGEGSIKGGIGDLLDGDNRFFIFLRIIFHSFTFVLFPKYHIKNPPVTNIQIEYAAIGMLISILFNIDVAITIAKVPF